MMWCGGNLSDTDSAAALCMVYSKTHPRQPLRDQFIAGFHRQLSAKK